MRCLALAIVIAACGGGGGGGSGGVVDPLDPSLRPAVDTDPSHYPDSVWITDGMAKLQPQETNPGQTKWVFLWAARNETESFQVHVRGPARFTVEVFGLSGIEAWVAREAYLDITTPSDANGMTGLVPDALVPAVDPYVGEPRNAFPADVPSGEIRSAWIDLFVPADTASGWYTGSVLVRDGRTTLAELPVVLAVWDAEIPSTATLASGFGISWNGFCLQAYGSSEGCAAYPGAAGDPDAAI